MKLSYKHRKEVKKEMRKKNKTVEMSNVEKMDELIRIWKEANIKWNEGLTKILENLKAKKQARSS